MNWLKIIENIQKCVILYYFFIEIKTILLFFLLIKIMLFSIFSLDIVYCNS